MIARNSSIIFANTVLGGLLGFVALKVTALYIGRDPFGQFYFALGILGLYWFLADFAFSNAHTKRISEGGDPSDRIATYLGVKALMLAAYTLTFFASLLAILFWFPQKLESTSVPVLVIAFGYYFARGLLFIPQGTFDGRRETVRTQLGALADNLVRTTATLAAALIIAALLYSSGPLSGRVHRGQVALFDAMAAHPAETLAMTFFLGAVAQVAVLYWQMRRYRLGRFRWEIVKDYWRYSTPLILVSFIFIISTSIDRIAVGFFWSEGDVGDFSGAQRLTAIVDALPAAVATLLFPTISGMHAADDVRGVADITSRAIRYLSLVMLPVVIVSFALAPAIIHLVLADSFAGGASILGVLVLYTFLLALQRPFASLVQGMNRPDLSARIGVAMAVAVIVFNIILVPADVRSLHIRLVGLKGLGAALASLISGAIGLVLYFIAARKLAHVRLPWLSLFKQALAAALTIAVVLLLAHAVPITRWYHFIAYVALSGAAYLGSLLLLREFTREDLRLFWSIVSPWGFVRHIRSEFRKRKA